MNSKSGRHWWGLAVGLWLYACPAYSQGSDTVDYRMQESTLPDGTIISYELGAIGHITGQLGTPTTYVAMTNTQADGSFLRSASFAIGNSYDSIRFVRFAVFEDANRRTFEYTDDDSLGLADWMHGSIADTNKQVDPLTASFGTSSEVLYILELRDASNDAVLARLDTVRVYRNGSGDLRWRHYKGGGSMSYAAIGAYGPALVYLNVARVQSLPLGVNFTHDYLRMDNQSNGSVTFANGVWVGQMEWFALPPATPASSVAQNSPISSIHVYPNPSKDIVNIRYGSTHAVQGRLSVLNVLGQLEYAQKLDITKRENTISCDLSWLRSGSYTVVISGLSESSFYATSNLTLSN